MIERIGAAPTPPDEAARLRGVARQMESVFVQELFKAMRETVPEGGLFGGGAGEEMFTSMMDQEMAGHVPAQWESGLAKALYRQLAEAAGVAAEESAEPKHGELHEP